MCQTKPMRTDPSERDALEAHATVNPDNGPISRSHFFRLMAAGGAAFLGMAPQMFAQGGPEGGPGVPRGPVSPWARLKFRGRDGDTDDWNVHPNGDLNLVDAIRGQGLVNVQKQWNVADIEKLESLTPFPFLFMHAEIGPDLDASSRNNLREYLMRGGFLFAEDCVNGKGRSNHSGEEFFLRMAEDEIPAILPEAKLERLPNNHPLFECYYQFPEGIPHMQGKPHGLHGIFLKGRLVGVLSPSDTHCGWTNGDRWFGPGQQALAMKFGINVYLYAMTQGGVPAGGGPTKAAG